MVRLFRNSNIYGMVESISHPLEGIADLFNLRVYLAGILGVSIYGPHMITLMNKLEGRGYLTPEDTGTDTYWIVEKAIPKEHRGAVRTQQLQPHEVIKLLKV